jgi:hypothetical protein
MVALDQSRRPSRGARAVSLRRKKCEIQQRIALMLCKSLRSTMLELTYPAIESMMELVLAIGIGIGDGPPSKKTTAIPSS